VTGLELHRDCVLRVSLEWGIENAKRRDTNPVVEAFKKDIDRTLIRANLKLPVEDRFHKAMALARFADELRRAGREVRSRKP
jgi:hypothetical protein